MTSNKPITTLVDALGLSESIWILNSHRTSLLKWRAFEDDAPRNDAHRPSGGVTQLAYVMLFLLDNYPDVYADLREQLLRRRSPEEREDLGLLTRKETCDKLGIGRETLRQWMLPENDGLGFPQPIRNGKQSLLYVESEIDAWLDSRRVAGK